MSLEDPALSNAEADSLSDEDVLATISDPKPPLDSTPSRPTRTVESALTLLHSLKLELMRIALGSEATQTSPLVDNRPSETLASTPSLRVILDKIDIMDPVAPPTVKAKGKRGGVGEVVGQGRESGVADENGEGASTNLGDNEVRIKGLEVVRDKSQNVQEIWTKVLYVAPSFAGVEGEKLRRISGKFPSTPLCRQSFQLQTTYFRF